MRFTAEQSQRWMELHKRKAELALARSQHIAADKDNEAAIFAAEIEKINGQIDALLRECMDENSHQEYRRSLSQS